jgi:hypothetical protein
MLLRGSLARLKVSLYFSTNEMRSTDGFIVIDQAIENMSTKHIEHIEVYG